MNRSRPRAGFTLIELLVVIGIVAVLTSLALVAVQKTRASAQRAERNAWMDSRRNGTSAGPRSAPLKVLFVGNSYTASNDLPGAVKALADASNTKPELIVGSHSPGGAKLKDHWEGTTVPDMIRGTDWDFIVLQEQSQTPLPAFGRNSFYLPFGKKFNELIRDRGAIPILYLTWPRPDTPGFAQQDWTVSVTDLARDLRAEVSATGLAKELVEAQIPGFGFYADAGGHPTAAGTYLVACTFYATIYDRSPEGLPASVTTANGTVVGVPPAQAAIVQKAAADAQVKVKKILDRDPQRTLR